MVNLLILLLLIAVMDRDDTVSKVVVAFYIACLSALALSTVVYIPDSWWFLICVFIDLSIISACILCYDKEKDILLIIYMLVVLVVYLIPDIYQYYIGEIGNYATMTLAASVIDILIVGRSHVIKRRFCGYNGCNKHIGGSGSSGRGTD